MRLLFTGLDALSLLLWPPGYCDRWTGAREAQEGLEEVGGKGGTGSAEDKGPAHSAGTAQPQRVWHLGRPPRKRNRSEEMPK